MKLFLLTLAVAATSAQAPHTPPNGGMEPLRQRPHSPPNGDMEPLRRRPTSLPSGDDEQLRQSGCANQFWKGDRFCDDENNTPECDWDGGDCCDNDYGWWNYYCTACECLDPAYQTPSCGVPVWKGDNYCDNENNNEGCEWDGGDCCGNTFANWDYYCQPNCECLDPNHEDSGSGSGGGSGNGDGDCNCGVKNQVSRIVGGQETIANEFPWQIALMSKSDDFQFCGGSLLNDRFVLTAAHCTQNQNPGALKVRLGEHDKSYDSDGAIDVDVAEVIEHPAYNPSTITHDYAIIRLATPIVFSSTVRPVCLPASASATYANVVGVASGWGRLATGQPGPQSLHHVELDVYAPDSCMEWSQYNMIDSSMICAGGVDGKGTCNGDSGGPLVTEENGSWTLIGVTSWGSATNCVQPGFPSVFARVTKVLNWINSNIASGVSCPAP